MTCADCIHFNKCFEQRGPCREYKTLDMIRREIIDINNAYKAKTSARTTTSDQAADTPESLRRRDMDP